VRIIAGPMMDQEGKVLEVKNKVAKVAIDSLGYILIASIERTKLMAAQRNQTPE
ncbi:MAG: KOW motif-containing protein, partial [Flavisolibacter sp.]|nr:KOW motif-containing protein [Flavisolibacter sp.]